MTEHNRVFRGINDKLYEERNDNFLGLIKILAKFDSILKRHILNSTPTVERAKRKQTYLLHSIQMN